MRRLMFVETNMQGDLDIEMERRVHEARRLSVCRQIADTLEGQRRHFKGHIHQHRWTPEERQQLTTWLQLGHSPRTIATRFGRTINSIYRQIEHLRGNRP